MIAAFVFLIACGGDGCSGCGDGCAVAPIPGGYPLEQRIDNSAQVRLTESGVVFLEQNVSAILEQLLPTGLDFDVSGGDICPDGGCVIHGELHGFDIEPLAPRRLRVHVQLGVTSRDGSGARAPIYACFNVLVPVCCDIDVDTAWGARPDVGLLADLEFVAELEEARDGYTKIVLGPGNGDQYFAPSQELEPDDFVVSGGGLCSIVDLFKSFVAAEINNQFGQQIQDAADDALCTRRGEYGCPVGTFAVPDEDPDSKCRYADSGSAECVSVLLGADGQGDLGAAALGTLSPGIHAPGQFLLASAGDGEATNGGLSLFFFGGFMGTDPTFTTTPAHSPCVPVVQPPALPVIPRLESFRGNVIPGTSTPVHVGIGIAEKFLDYAGYGAFDSGLLCMSAGTQLSQTLTTGLLSVFVSSIENLSFPATFAPVALALRPQRPPDIEVGVGTESDPLLLVTFPDLETDIYVWSLERYVRVLSYKATLAIPMGLVVEGAKLRPTVGEIAVTGSSVSHTELLAESPGELTAVLDSLLPTLMNTSLGLVQPMDLPTVGAFQLEVPETGIRGITEAGEEFLGIFASLAYVEPASALTVAPRASVSLERIDVDPRALKLHTWREGRPPSAELSLGAIGPGRGDIEFSYRLDGMPWSVWRSERHVTLQDRALRLQARHVLEVRARYEDGPSGAIGPVARLEIPIDVTAPRVRAERLDDGVQVVADDLLTAQVALVARTRVDGAPWTAWRGLVGRGFVPVGHDDAVVDVEVRDEAGNVGVATAALIRGRPNPAATACSCRVPGAGPRPSRSVFWVFVGALALVLLRDTRRHRRRRISRPLGPIILGALCGIAFSAVGCDCRDKDPEPCGGECRPASGGALAGTACCSHENECVSYDLDALCMVGPDPGYICSGAEAVKVDRDCEASCSDCVKKPALDPGLLATHLDFAVRDDGNVLVSGYSPGDPPARPFGDLVVGVYDTVTRTTAWEIVDGAPSSPITNDSDGWRRGVSAPGDDVGLWTSIAISGVTAYVSYYDATNGALKLAVGHPGSWTVHTVDGLDGLDGLDGFDDSVDSGRYTSLVLSADGFPVVAYMRMGEVSSRDPQRLEGSVQVAEAASATPSAASDWTITQVASGDIPCRAGGCASASGATCVTDGRCVTPTADCTRDCGDRVCSGGSCQTPIAAVFVDDYPVSYGLYVSLARTSDGLAIVYYDRVNGNIWGVSRSTAGWGAPFLIDGYARAVAGVGDSGIGASLFVDSTDVWHVTYVDGAEEALRYARVAGGTVTYETVDTGVTDGTSIHTDGRHLVGDDSSIVVNGAGVARVVYQDATATHAMLATRASGSSSWTISVLDEADATGFFVEQALVATSGTSVAMTFWRRETPPAANGVRLLTL